MGGCLICWIRCFQIGDARAKGWHFGAFRLSLMFLLLFGVGAGGDRREEEPTFEIESELAVVGRAGSETGKQLAESSVTHGNFFEREVFGEAGRLRVSIGWRSSAEKSENDASFVALAVAAR